MQSFRFRDAFRDALISLLLSLGLIMSLLGMAGLLSSHWAPALVCTAGICIVTGFLFRMRHGKLLVFLLLLAGAGAWLALGGIRLIRETALVVAYAQQGLTFLTLPWIGVLALPLAAVITVLCCAIVHARASALALSAVMLLVLGLWLTKSEGLIWMLIPSCAAALTLWSVERGTDAVAWKSLLLSLTVSALVCAAAVPLQGLTAEPLRENAEQLRQELIDRYFFTQPRNMFSLAGVGWYPHEQRLGGKPNPSERLIMTVETPETVYLRGAILDTYTGSAWTDSGARSRYLWDSARQREIRRRVFDEDLPADGSPGAVSLHVTMQSDNERDRVSTLFVPQRVREITAENLVLYFNESSEVFATRDLTKGDAYSVSALRTVAGEEGLDRLLEACALRGDPETDARVLSVYTALPEHLNNERELIRIAGQAAGGAGTRYRRAVAIRDWLRGHCTYTLDVADPAPNEDFVAAFLITTRKGYCTYFASAMTVLCRMNGIPARYIEGFLAAPGEDGIAQVTGREGHAWVEVWFPGYGWLTFDPTPPSEEDGPQGSGQNPPQHGDAPTPPPSGQDPESLPPSDEPNPTPKPPEESPEDAPDDREQQEPEDAPGTAQTGSSAWWIWLLILLLAAAAVTLCALRIRSRRPQHLAAKAGSEAQRWQIWMQALCDALRARGETRPAGSTLAQWMAALDRERRETLLGPIGESAGVIFYGHEEPLADETGAVIAAFGAVWKTLTAGQRLRFVLRRSFTKKHSFMNT